MEDHTFSPVHFFESFKKAIAEVNKYPLTSKNIVIQGDAYKRLATVIEDDPADGYEQFAVLECGRKEKDSDMRFAISFMHRGFLLEIESLQPITIPFDYFTSEKQAVSQIKAALIMLANGQLRALLTKRNGIYCASETLLYGPKDARPTVIATLADYPRTWRVANEEGYEVEVLANHYLDNKIAIPPKWFLGNEEVDGQKYNKGRVLTTAELTPLTKRMHQQIIEELNLQYAGKPAEQGQWAFLYSAWEFWVFIGTCLVLISLLKSSNVFGGFFKDWPYIAFGVPALILLYWIFIPLLHRKEALKQTAPHHPWLRLDRVIKRVFPIALRIIIPLFLLFTTFWHIFATNSKQTVSLYAFDVPIWVHAVVPVLLGLATLAAIMQRKWTQLSSTVAVIAGVIAILAINFTVTNTAADTPEPYSSIASGLYLVLPIVSIFLTRAFLKSQPRDVASTKSEVLPAKGFLEQLLTPLDVIRAVICLITPFAIFAGAYVFSQKLPASATKYTTVTPIWLALFCFGLVFLGLTCLLLAKQLKAIVFTYAIMAITFLALGFVAFSLKEDGYQGPGLGWWLVLVPVIVAEFSVLISGGVREMVTKQRANAELFATAKKS